MRDCRRDPYVVCVWPKPWPIPMKPPVTRARWPSRNAFPARALSFRRGFCHVRKCSQVDSHTGYV
jgi:hypothetical protein